MVKWFSLFFTAALLMGEVIVAQDKPSGFDSLVSVIEKNSQYRVFYDRKLTSALSIPQIAPGSQS